MKSHRVDGDHIILTLRSGGEVTCDKNLVEKVEPDEVPYVNPDAPKAADPEASSQVQPDESLLDWNAIRGNHRVGGGGAGVNPLLVRALIQVESKFRPTAPVPEGGDGPHAVDAFNGSGIQRPNPFEPKANIEAGIKHLKSLIDRFDSSAGAGACRVQRWAGGGREVQRRSAVPRNSQLRHAYPVPRRTEV